MCIFAGPVEQVSGTRIYVARQGNQQFTAYQMEVQLPESDTSDLDPWAAERGGNARSSNAMILPVPVAPRSLVSLVDLSSVPDFFDKLNEPFIERTRGFSKGVTLSRGLDYLEVHDVGDYKVSIAYAVDAINQADPSVFQLSGDTSRILSAYYSMGYAFVIASLKDNGKISPLGYISDIPEHLLKKDYPLFIPTRHEHGDHSHDGHYQDPAWDHFIYVGGTGRFKDRPEGNRPVAVRGSTLGKHNTQALVDASRGFVQPGPISRMRAEGRLANVDLYAGT